MKIKKPISERLFSWFSVLVLCLFVFICVYPFYYVAIGSIAEGNSLQGTVFWPQKVSFKIYSDLLVRGDIYNAFAISISRTVLGTVICTFFTALLAYLLTQEKMYFRKFVYRFYIIAMYFSAGLIPWYITMKAYGLQNNFLLYIIPFAVNPFFLILVKTFIESLPKSVEESAEIDGAGFFRRYLWIILPLIKPILATIAVFGAVEFWNTWRDNYFLVTDERLQTLQLILYKYLQQAQNLANSMRSGFKPGMVPTPISPMSVRMAMIIISTIPIILVYPFLQRYFTKGIMLGAVKG